MPKQGGKFVLSSAEESQLQQLNSRPEHPAGVGSESARRPVSGSRYGGPGDRRARRHAL